MRFIHCADIHLDSPLRGLERYEGAPVEDVRGAERLGGFEGRNYLDPRPKDKGEDRGFDGLDSKRTMIPSAAPR